jgi:type III restriction enzyme
MAACMELNIVIETKDVEDKTVLRGEEEIKINCAKIFFQTLAADGYTVIFRDQLHNKQIKAIINEVMAQEERIPPTPD